MWILIAIPVVITLWLAVVYNMLISLKNQTLNAWRQIEIQLKRRYDLIPNLVETVRGIMKFEQETLAMVIEARNKAATAQGVAEKAQKENILAGTLRQLFALVESYPQLKSNENVLRLQEELSSTENRISFARQFYNDIATKFNVKQQTFPINMVAKVFNFKQAELFEVARAEEKETPRVDLNLI